MKPITLNNVDHGDDNGENGSNKKRKRQKKAQKTSPTKNQGPEDDSNKVKIKQKHKRRKTDKLKEIEVSNNSVLLNESVNDTVESESKTDLKTKGFEQKKSKKNKQKSKSPGNIGNNAGTSLNVKTHDLKKKFQTKEDVRRDEIGGFTILGSFEEHVKKKVPRSLPKWLRSPTIITADIRNNTQEISKISELHPTLVQNLIAKRITHFFPVQSVVIPWLLDNLGRSFYRPHDICVSAPTGSGKTLAFALPIVQSLMQRVVINVRVLVVLPVRDLAIQVHDVFQMCCRNTSVKVGLAVGDKAFSAEQELLVKDSIQGFMSLVDIIIATPGRLVDHLTKTPGFSLKHLKFIVLDEADRMMEEIKQDWLSHVEQHVQLNVSDHKFPCVPGVASVENDAFTAITPSNINQWISVPQKLLFSATLSQDPEKLEHIKLFQPKLFTAIVPDTMNEGANLTKINNQFIGKYTTPAELKEYYIHCDQDLKPLILYYLLEHHKYTRVLCFTNSLETTKRLTLLMKQMTQLRIKEISSLLSITERQEIIQCFKQNELDVIISTDVLARGMDIEDVQYVISYDTPSLLKKYIHRVGRTARAGKPGSAISFLLKKEISMFQKFLLSAGKEHVKEIVVDRNILESYEEAYRSALQAVAGIIKG